MKKMFCFCALVFGSTFFGALSPLAQSSKEMDYLLTDGELFSNLDHSEVIEQIIRVENGYLVLTQKNLIQVDIEYLPQEYIGPRKFKFHYRSPIELRKMG